MTWKKFDNPSFDAAAIQVHTAAFSEERVQVAFGRWRRKSRTGFGSEALSAKKGLTID